MSRKNPKPPRLALRLFLWYCSDPLREEIAGDMEERFLDHCELHGRAVARRKYWLNVFKFFRWHTLKRRSKSNTQTNISMLKNYFKVAFRSALKQKAYSFINLTGLAVGLTSFILILLYVQHQLSFDQFHEKKDRVFRVHDGKDAITANVVAPFVEGKFEEEVVRSTRLLYMGSQFFTINEETYAERVLFSDSTFFDMFSFPLIAGQPDQVLTQPHSMVISQKMALQWFGRTNIVGESFDMEGDKYQVTGVMADVPKNSSMEFDFVAPLNDVSWTRLLKWGNRTYFTYLELADGVDPEALATKIVEEVDGTFGVPPGSQEGASVYLQPIDEIYLQPDWKLAYEPGKTGDITYVYIFSAVAVLILLIACVNYVNLSTSRSLERAREVGIRKVVGAYRRQLIIQFLAESFLFVFGSLIASYWLSMMLLPYFEQLAGIELPKTVFYEPSLLLGLVGLGLFITLLAGFYPAMVLSFFKPVSVLKGSFKHSGTGSRLRKGLVIFQFAISSFLLIATLVVNKQLNFIQNKKLGYNREHVLAFVIDGDLRDNRDAFKNKLAAMPGVISTTFSSHLPVSIGSAHSIQTGPTDEEWELIYFMYADEDMMDVTGMNLKAGVSLKDIQVPFDELDTTGIKPSFILNETTARLFNWSAEEAVGKVVNLGGVESPIQGIVEDFHFKSLEQNIEPFVIMHNPRRFYYSMVKVSGENIAQTVSQIEATVAELAPALPFNYSFLDERFDRLYQFESRLSDVFLTFATIAIVIACLGMFGLISFMAVNRSKEFGIRKVLGARVSTIVFLLSRDFMKLILIALLVSLPLGYYLMSGWLQDYAYAATLGLDVGVLAILFAFTVTLLTIGYQALKTAYVNPAKVLRNE